MTMISPLESQPPLKFLRQCRRGMMLLLVSTLTPFCGMMLLLASTLRHDVTNFSYATFLQQQLMVFVCVLFLISLLLLLFDDVTSRLYNRTFWQHFCSRDIDDSFSHPPRWPPWCPLWWRVSFCKNYLVEFSIFSSQQLHF